MCVKLLPMLIVYFFLIILFETEGLGELLKDKRYLRREKYINGLSNFVPTEFDMPTTQLIFLHGYETESHTVTTDDGYILTIHRVLRNQKHEASGQNKVALLHHGLLGSSADWVLLGTKKSLPYLLSDAGYDVWLANARGNIYSRAHTSLLSQSCEFWDFSWHEIGMYDMLALIEHIHKTTEGTPINFIGHSMGATAFFVFLSIYPQFKSYFSNAILLAPLVYMSQVEGPLRFLAENHDIDKNLAHLLNDNEFMMINKFSKSVTNKYCTGIERVCSNTLLFISNGGQAISDSRLLENIIGHVPAGASTKTIKHYCQLIKSGQFHMYDLGTKENVKKFGMMSPPVYSLKNITMPIAIFSGTHDWLSKLPDNKRLSSEIKAFRHHIVRTANFSHTDFVWGEDASELVFILILEILNPALKDITKQRL